MGSKEVIEKINNFLIEEFEVEEELIKPEKNFRETLEFDSLDYIDLVVEIENNFGLKITAEGYRLAARG